MKLLVITLLLATTAYADETTAFGYLTKYGVPRAEKIREAEEAYNNDSESRIVGGVAAAPGQFPYQAGLLIDLVNDNRQSICGASLVSNQRLVTAAHCWFDGRHQAWRFTVVLGSNLLFTGGTRVETSAVVNHPDWLPAQLRNDIAIIYLPSAVATSATISPIALPTGSQVNENFAGETAVASGFGLTSDDGFLNTGMFLSHVSLNVLTNSVCALSFPIIQSSNICTSDLGGVGPCNGDSGGPLTVTRNGQPILIGVTSFVSGMGCELPYPGAFARVTSFLDFINSHL